MSLTLLEIPNTTTTTVLRMDDKQPSSGKITGEKNMREMSLQAHVHRQAIVRFADIRWWVIICSDALGQT